VRPWKPFAPTATRSVHDHLLLPFPQIKFDYLRNPSIVQAARGLAGYRVSAPGATCLAQPLRDALPLATVSRKKICDGRVRSATPGAGESGQEFPSPRACAPGRCAAIPRCRKSCNAHGTKCEGAGAAHEIVSGRFRSATAGRLRKRRDGPAPTGAWNAGCSKHGTPGS
jgi:hypothetical protein